MNRGSLQLGRMMPRLVYPLCVLLVATALSSCSHDAAQSTVGVVGDSITALSDSQIVKAIHGSHLVVEARSGETIRYMTPWAEAHIMKGPNGPPRSIFINLGTNDILQGNRHWLRNCNTLMKDTSSVPCEVLFTLNTVIDAYVQPGAPTAVQFNRTIEMEQKADPTRIHVIDWSRAVHADFGLISLDGVHPPLKGQEWIAQHIATTLNNVCKA